MQLHLTTAAVRVKNKMLPPNRSVSWTTASKYSFWVSSSYEISSPVNLLWISLYSFCCAFGFSLRNCSAFDSALETGSTPVKNDTHKEIKFKVVKLRIVEGGQKWTGSPANRGAHLPKTPTKCFQWPRPHSFPAYFHRLRSRVLRTDRCIWCRWPSSLSKVSWRNDQDRWRVWPEMVEVQEILPTILEWSCTGLLQRNWFRPNPPLT